MVYDKEYYNKNIEKINKRSIIYQRNRYLEFRDWLLDIKREYKIAPKTLKELISGQFASEPFEASYLQAMSKATSGLSNLMKGGDNNA